MIVAKHDLNLTKEEWGKLCMSDIKDKEIKCVLVCPECNSEVTMLVDDKCQTCYLRDKEENKDN